MFKKLTDDDLALLEDLAVKRKDLPREDRSSFTAPKVARETILGGGWWACSCLWQDSPVVVVIGVGLVILQSIRTIQFLF